jgi:hypothetical protein
MSARKVVDAITEADLGGFDAVGEQAEKNSKKRGNSFRNINPIVSQCKSLTRFKYILLE